MSRLSVSIKKTLMILMLISPIACSTPTIVKHPDAPMLILGSKGKWLKVCTYNKTLQEMVYIGWISTDQLDGWTLHKYDWQKWIIENTDLEDNLGDAPRTAHPIGGVAGGVF